MGPSPPFFFSLFFPIAAGEEALLGSHRPQNTPSPPFFFSPLPPPADGRGVVENGVSTAGWADRHSVGPRNIFLSEDMDG